MVPFLDCHGDYAPVCETREVSPQDWPLHSAQPEPHEHVIFERQRLQCFPPKLLENHLTPKSSTVKQSASVIWFGCIFNVLTLTRVSKLRK